MNTHRQLGAAGNAGSRSMEKLSSGYRINRAGDDAAGLSISEKMRGQIRGLNQASSNAQDGISLIQTAEGALNETHAILQRMRELAVQSSTDTNTGVDRAEIQKEIDQLSQEITRIADQTEFNTQKLLDGNFASKKFHIGANEGQDVDLSISAMNASSLGVKGKAYTATDVTGVTGLQVTGTSDTAVTIEFADLSDGTAAAVAKTEAIYDADNNKITITLKQAAGDGTDPGAIEATHAEVKAALESVAGDVGIQVSTLDTFDGTTTGPASVPASTSVSTTEDTTKEVGINVSSQTAASGAITTLNSAIETVSAERSKLGAMQNRLEHTIKNLDTSAENLQASESRIRDVDYAEAA